MILNERKTEQGLLVAVCDREVLGETFVDGEVSLTVSEEFYGTETASESEIVESLQRASVANIVGTDAVELAVEHGFVDQGNVLEVDRTAHAQLIRLG